MTLNKLDASGLYFPILFERALQDWPPIIEMRRLERADAENYSVLGLALQVDNIADSYIEDPEEIIMRNLHTAIFSSIHSAAKYSVLMEIRHLRSSAVRANFHERLRKAVCIKALKWTQADIALVDRYFAQNL